MNPKDDYGYLYNTNKTPGPEQKNSLPTPPDTPETIQEAANYAVHTLPPKPADPPKPKKPFSPIPLLLTAGVIFLFLGGIIFLTNTWDMLPNAARAVFLLSASAIAFGASYLAEKILKLPKTGLAFFLLGSIFLPLAVIGIGAFALLGNWFCFQGDGKWLVWACAAACLAAACQVGQRHYQSTLLAGVSLTGTAGIGIFLTQFFTETVCILPPGNGKVALWGGLLLLWAVLFTAGCEVIHHRRPDSRNTKVCTGVLYVLLWYLFIAFCCGFHDLLSAGMQRELPPVAAAVLFFLLGLLFVNGRFRLGQMHHGVYGSTVCLIACFGNCVTCYAPDCNGIVGAFAVCAATAMLLMSCFWLLPHKTGAVYSKAGMVTAIPASFVGGVAVLFGALGSIRFFLFNSLLYLGFLLFVAFQFFTKTPRNPLAGDTPLFCVFCILLFLSPMLYTAYGDTHRYSAQTKELVTLVLIFGAILLLIGTFRTKRPWMLVLSVCACAGVLLSGMPYGALIWFWVCAVLAFAGTVYAHIAQRPLFEKCCAWVGIALLMVSLDATFLQCELNMLIGSVILLSVLVLLYLTESVFLRYHLRTVGTVGYLELLSLLILFCTLIYQVDPDVLVGVQMLLIPLLLFFAAVFLRKAVNFASLLPLITLFAACSKLIGTLKDLSLPHGMLCLLQFLSYVLVLALFAGMGRYFLPQFYSAEDGKQQIDFPLLVGAAAVFGAAGTIDWHGTILTCLFLSLYSLLYLGRVKSRTTPTELSLIFGCLALFFHNCIDPFEILHTLGKADFHALCTLIYLLPLHLFVFVQLFIFPQNRKQIHAIRFGVYCLTMVCMMLTSLGSGKVNDALVMVLFCFAVLAGSFAVKRLRWFTLGFAVLVLMTLRMTANFWRSLHWGVYLFLAGLALIGFALFYELSSRRAAEHPDEPKRRKIFADWKW